MEEKKKSRVEAVKKNSHGLYQQDDRDVQYPAARPKVAERFGAGRFAKEIACPWHGACECS